MTALTATYDTHEKPGGLIAYPIAANTTLFKGTLVEIVGGFAQPAGDGPPAVLFGGLLDLPPLQKRRQDGGEQFCERNGFEAKENAKAIFGEAL